MREEILQAVTETLGLSTGQVHVQPVSGGSIARSFRLEDSRRRLFVKLLAADQADILDPAFFNACQGMWPLEPGWRARRRFYQLYHMLNHANLFGGHYVGICRKLIEDLGQA